MSRSRFYFPAPRSIEMMERQKQERAAYDAAIADPSLIVRDPPRPVPPPRYQRRRSTLRPGLFSQAGNA